MIDKKRIQSIHTDLAAVLKKFADDNGLSVSPFNMTYSATGFKFAVQMGDKSEIGDVDPVFAANTKKFGLWFNLSSADLGKEFSFGIDKVKFLGFKNKNTVIYEKNGQKFRTDATRFAEAVGVKKPMVLTQVAAPKI
jgi:hypothetical protein